MSTINSHKTAIARKTLPVPTRWLLKEGMIKGHVLDFGCGKCEEINARVLNTVPGIVSVTSYDPYYAPRAIENSNRSVWDTVLCNYVLCTLPEEMELEVLKEVQKRVSKNGVAFISVRNDVPKNGYGVSSKGTYQRKVELNLPLVHKTSEYRIYRLTADSKLV